MKESEVNKESSNINIETKSSETTIIDTHADSKNGQDKCPNCGATDIVPSKNTGKLRCRFCRTEFEPVKAVDMIADLKNLTGDVISSGAHDIDENASDIITLKCDSCGAEVVVDTSSSKQARCHWCRNTLSINHQVPNGSVPDVVLPFSINKENARLEIEKFVGKRKFFANSQFKREFTTENIMGVYFPYMLIDVNAHASFVGEGEHQIRKYYRGNGEHQKAYYDAEVYHIERDFDIIIKGLSIESSKDRLDITSNDKTNNIINAIMPFDIENCIKFNANYLKGYTSEKRDTNIDDLRIIVNTQSQDIARFAANDTLKAYDRGVCWSKEQFDIRGQQWKAAYLPVWLYSYLEVKGNKKLLHYVAVNARTKETMGSVPIHMPKLLLVSGIVELVGFVLMWFVDFDYSWVFLLAGFVYFFIMYARYRNSGARHTYELETTKEISNLNKKDVYVETRKGLSNSTMNGANNKRVNGSKAYGKNFGSNVLNNFTENNVVAGFIKDNNEKKDNQKK